MSTGFCVYKLSGFLRHCESEGRGNLVCEEIASHPMGARNDISGKGLDRNFSAIPAPVLRSWSAAEGGEAESEAPKGRYMKSALTDFIKH